MSYIQMDTLIDLADLCDEFRNDLKHPKKSYYDAFMKGKLSVIEAITLCHLVPIESLEIIKVMEYDAIYLASKSFAHVCKCLELPYSIKSPICHARSLKSVANLLRQLYERFNSKVAIVVKTDRETSEIIGIDYIRQKDLSKFLRENFDYSRLTFPCDSSTAYIDKDYYNNVIKTHHED